MVLELEHLKSEISFKPQNTILVPLRGVRFKDFKMFGKLINNWMEFSSDIEVKT